VEFAAKGSDRRIAGQATDVSLGGMFIRTGEPLVFATELVVHMKVPAQRAVLTFPAVVRWVGPAGMGVQFGLLGARETHAITELTR
jgi:type IV pilus assembly protein PilZ